MRVVGAGVGVGLGLGVGVRVGVGVGVGVGGGVKVIAVVVVVVVLTCQPLFCLNRVVHTLQFPHSSMAKFLQVMQKHGYVGDFEIVDDHRSGKIVVDLIGRL